MALYKSHSITLIGVAIDQGRKLVDLVAETAGQPIVSLGALTCRLPSRRATEDSSVAAYS